MYYTKNQQQTIKKIIILELMLKWKSLYNKKLNLSNAWKIKSLSMNNYSNHMSKIKNESILN